MENKDDILESALNAGIAFTAEKLDLSKIEVYNIVMKFKEDINDLCSCDKAKLKGITMMCFACDGRSNRIKV